MQYFSPESGEIRDSGEKTDENHAELGSPCATHRAMQAPTSVT
jgi:hypothetical protein